MNTLLTNEDIERIEVNATTVLNVTKHFSVLSAEVVQELLGQEYQRYDAEQGRMISVVATNETLSEALQTPGSKFTTSHRDFFAPAQVILTAKKTLRDRISKEQIAWMETEPYWHIQVTQLLDEMIGTLGVVSLSELTTEERGRVTKERREENGPMVYVLRDATSRYTNQLAIGMYKRKDDGKIYITAYPGIAEGPPLPSAEQSEADRKVSEEYWREKVFLV